jgi:hypothetical protein
MLEYGAEAETGQRAAQYIQHKEMKALLAEYGVQVPDEPLDIRPRLGRSIGHVGMKLATSTFFAHSSAPIIKRYGKDR